MRYDEWASIGHAHGWLGARDTDPQTSRDATKNLAVRAGSQRWRMLNTYTHRLGLTDAEAAEYAGLNRLGICFWKRASELRQAGYIEPVGERGGRMTCQITSAGWVALDAI